MSHASKHKLTQGMLLAAVLTAALGGPLFTQSGKATPKVKKEDNLLAPQKNSQALKSGKNSVERTGALLDKEILALNQQIQTIGAKIKEPLPGTPHNMTLKLKGKSGNGTVSLIIRDMLYDPYQPFRKIIGNLTLQFSATFKGGKLTTIAIIEDRQYLRDNHFEITEVINGAPFAKTTDHITSDYKNQFKEIAQKFSEIENKLSNPQRNDFKRSFYIPLLRRFVRELDRIQTFSDHARRRNRESIYDRFNR